METTRLIIPLLYGVVFNRQQSHTNSDSSSDKSIDVEHDGNVMSFIRQNCLGIETKLSKINQQKAIGGLEANLPHEMDNTYNAQKKEESEETKQESSASETICSSPQLPVKLQCRGPGDKKRSITVIPPPPFLTLKEELEQDTYLQKLYEDLHIMKQKCDQYTPQELQLYLRDKENEILFYRNQQQIANYYGGKVIKSNGSDFILLPGTVIPSNLPEGFTFALRETNHTDGSTDYIFIQSMKNVRGI